ncbi:MAG: hypothetical protein AAF492_22410, partial [Verrucomicrobiota bacterium]
LVTRAENAVHFVRRLAEIDATAERILRITAADIQHRGHVDSPVFKQVVRSLKAMARRGIKVKAEVEEWKESRKKERLEDVHRASDLSLLYAGADPLFAREMLQQSERRFTDGLVSDMFSELFYQTILAELDDQPGGKE